MPPAPGKRPPSKGATKKRAGATNTELIERLAFESLLVELYASLSDAVEGDFLTRTEEALGRVMAYLDCDRCTFSEFVGGDYLNVLCSVGTPEFGSLPRARFQFPFRWFINELRSGRVVALADPLQEIPPEAVEELSHCRRVGLLSHVSVPVRIGGRVASVLSFAAVRAARDWPPEVISRLRIISDLLGSAVALARSEEEAVQLRHRLWHTDRVQRVSTLTAAIAHEINQPLAAILSNAQAGTKYLARGAMTPESMKDILEAVVREGKRAADTIRTMRAMIRQDAYRSESIDLADALGEVQRLVESDFAGRGVHIDTRFESGCWVLADRVQMEQVALNLLSNAAAAVRDGPPERRFVWLRVARRGERVLMSVRDAGSGIAAQNLHSIFEPFWTTRQEGMGLGLAICRSIVEAHGGRIWAESNPEGGATFSVELARAAMPPDAAVASRGADDLSTTAAREVDARGSAQQPLVCVVDDDAEVRGSLLRLLDGAGWSAIGYVSAQAFLDHPPDGQVACLLLDVQMPGLSGPQLHERLILDGCAPPVIFVTGRSDVTAGIDAMKRGATDFLEKPVDGEVLLAAVRRAVERHASEHRDGLMRRSLNERIARLSPREQEIMKHVVAGRLNKQIAADLSIVEQTVKQHRGRVMEKMEVRSVAELVRLCETAGLV